MFENKGGKTMNMKHHRILVFVLWACASVTAVSATPKTKYGEAPDSALIDQWLEMYNTADISQADKIFTPDFVPHFPLTLGTPIVDRASYLASIETPGVLNAQIVLEDLFGAGDEFVGRFTITAEWPLPVPPYSIPYTNTAIVFFRFAGDRIAEEWWETDFLGVLEQVGAMPRTRPTYSWSAPSSVTGDPGVPGQNASLAIRVTQAANTGNFVLFDYVVSAEYVNHNPLATSVVDRDAEAVYIQAVLTAFPDRSISIEDLVADGDRVAIRCEITGTQLGTFAGLPATGRQVHLSSMAIFRIADRQIVEGWWAEDALSLILQLTAP